MGTVGLATINILQNQSSLVAARCGREVRVTHVGARRDHPDHNYGDAKVSRDVMDVARDPDVDVVVELIGGTTVAHEVMKIAIEHGKHVVTANKALIAEHGNQLIALAEASGVQLCFEAAVAGGIPVIKSVREALAGNSVSEVAGIINGTANFILTEMSNKGRAFEEVLLEAQALGYAEADPTFDVDGTDAAHKLVILASLAFGAPLSIDAPAKQISIFMSPLNVHANYYPVEGEVTYSKYHPGLFLVAWHPKSSTENERTTMVVKHPKGNVLFRQIAGAVARRIVCYAKPGEQVGQNQECGFIKFGSRVDVIVPCDVEVTVKIGDKVKGRITELARWT